MAKGKKFTKSCQATVSQGAQNPFWEKKNQEKNKDLSMKNFDTCWMIIDGDTNQSAGIVIQTTSIHICIAGQEQ